MRTKEKLIRENEYLRKMLKKQKQEVKEIDGKLFDLQSKHLCLIIKYNKLMDSCLSSETDHITYNGELYSIKTIDYHKDAETVDSINIEAIKVQREKGLINNLSEPFKNVAKELNKIFFGDENI